MKEANRMHNVDKTNRFKLNAGTGMVLGIIIAAIIALVVTGFTGNSDVWTWAIPVGVAVGLAIGSSASRRK